MKRKNVMLLVMCLMVLSGSIMAVFVPVTNADFEIEDVPENQYLDNVLPSGWTDFGSGAFYPADSAFAAAQGIAGAQSGDQYLILHTWSGHITIRQELALDWTDLNAGDMLTLKMWTTYRSDLTPGDVYMWLNDSDGSGLYSGFDVTDGGATAAGTWVERTWAYIVTQENIDAGWGAVEIQIGHLGGVQTAYDNISVEHTAVPEPATLSLLGLAGCFVFRKRR